MCPSGEKVLDRLEGPISFFGTSETNNSFSESDTSFMEHLKSNSHNFCCRVYRCTFEIYAGVGGTVGGEEGQSTDI